MSITVLEGGVLQCDGVGQAIFADINVFGKKVKIATVGLVHAIQAFKYMNPKDLHVVGQGRCLPISRQKCGGCTHV